ncbi:SDR family NAD(P)-dependent oxidoreductase, partial [Klebsiella pneumoniae]|uniref:SDR family NAD(P)-dependent oxidoreductase n=1 Tax=Klebsiella pneumoniae TaxID=573 RepID=UPI00215856F7
PLSGKRVLIVGGTSGIGLSAAIQAKNAGALVTVVGREPEIAKRVYEEHGFEAWRAADVTSAADIEAALAEVTRVDHLVILAGTFVAGKVMEADLSYLRRAFDERIWSAIQIIRTLGDRLS